MASYNRVILVGNLTRDLELRYTPSGTAVTDIGLAVNDRRKNANGEWVEETTFVDVTLWGRTAEVASEYLCKGSSSLIEGRLKLDTWEEGRQKMQNSASSASGCGCSAARQRGRRWRRGRRRRIAHRGSAEPARHRRRIGVWRRERVVRGRRCARRRGPSAAGRYSVLERIPTAIVPLLYAS